MSIERIVDTAVEIADGGGLSAVSMSSVASALGFTPMSLYRYVTAKDDLVLLMQERGFGIPPESIVESSDWRSGLANWAHEQSRMYVEHPWLLDITIQGTPLTPNNLAWLDAALQVMEPLPTTLDEKVSTALAIIAQVRFEALITRGYVDAGVDPDSIDAQGVEVLQSLVTAEEFPFVKAALDDGAFSPVPDGNPFDFGLERLLDGIEAHLGGRSPVPIQRAPDDAATRDPKVREATKARREAEKQLREARKREREALVKARERAGR
jgi:AcrR family transcriptional regulator